MVRLEEQWSSVSKFSGLSRDKEYNLTKAQGTKHMYLLAQSKWSAELLPFPNQGAKSTE